MGNVPAPIAAECDAYGILVFGLTLLQDAAPRVDHSFAFSPATVIATAMSYQQDNSLSPGELFDEALRMHSVTSCAHELHSQTTTGIGVCFAVSFHVDDNFQANNGAVLSVPYLFNGHTVNLQYSKDDVFEVLAVPSSNPPNRRFLIFLPTEGRTLSEALNMLDAPRYLRLARELYEANVYVKVPKIDINQSRVEFGEIANVGSLRVTTDGSESRTLPSPVSEGSFLRRLRPRDVIKFVANRPFMFVMDDGNMPLLFGIFTGK